MQSVTSPLTAPVSPPRKRNMDVFIRLPLPFQRARAFFAAHTKKEDRVRGAWRVHAAVTGVMFGAALYALAALAAIPLCLTSAYLAALPAILAAAAGACLARRALLCRESKPKLVLVLSALSLLAVSAFFLWAVVSLARETLLPLARGSFIAAVSAGFLLLCTLGGAKGAAQLTFAQRFFLPALLLALSVKALQTGDSTGLFPILGMGVRPTALASALVLPAVLAVSGLAVPPASLARLDETAYRASVPGAGFFILRLLAGGAVAALLLMALSLGNTYEGLASLRSWGERMIILSYGAPREGMAGTLLTIMQILTLALSAVNALLGAIRALGLLVKGRDDA